MGKFQTQQGNEFIIEFEKEYTVYEYHIGVEGNIHLVKILYRDKQLLTLPPPPSRSPVGVGYICLLNYKIILVKVVLLI